MLASYVTKLSMEGTLTIDDAELGAFFVLHKEMCVAISCVVYCLTVN